MPVCYDCQQYKKEDGLTICKRMDICIKPGDIACHYFKKNNKSDFIKWRCPHCKKEYETPKKDLFANCTSCKINFVLKDFIKKRDNTINDK